ncbi:MAG: sporulation initiation factor Spo0A C-terminal domain-containing protein [Clostridiales bacterium]|jgi:two-component system response regulator (stage 0 sporulation protein A)|nr:sporulation initiation factor Spo0A C-terminal domain-containing protein [Clostridiales bacterium]
MDNTDLITSTLNNLRISTKLKGYDYLVFGIAAFLEDDNYSYSITKALYPHIAKNFKVSPYTIERSIRHAINNAWKNGAGEEFCHMLGLEVINCIKPSNGQFISVLARICQSGDNRLV